MGELVATRKAFGKALERLGSCVPDLVALDGDVENSTYTDYFSQKFPDRFIECYISEQNMIGISTGISSQGKIPFSSTFAAFFSRALDQIRIAGISRSNIKMVGTHSGISIGEDGPSQMGLEDLASMRAISGSTVLCPADAVSTEKLVEKMIQTQGLCYLRTARPETEVIYSNDETFEIGGAKVLRQNEKDQLTLIGTGITVYEILQAAEELKGQGIEVTLIDAYSIKPLARNLILSCAQKSQKRIITVEDHYIEGGLGDAVAGELSSEGIQVHKLGVREIPHSGKKDELMEKFEINAKAIIKLAIKIVSQANSQKAA